MQIEGSVVREHGVTFAVVVVKRHVLHNHPEASRLMLAFSPLFGGVPVVLMAQDARGVPTYYGRPDIAKFMARVPLSAVPWKRYQAA